VSTPGGMTVPFWSLFGFIAWTLLLLLSIGMARVVQVLQGHKRPSEFLSGVPHGGDRYWRLNRAHLNCLENLPLFAAVVLTAGIIGVDSPTLDRLSVVYLVARVCQSVTHISSGSDAAVNVRFGFFGVQLVCLVWMMLQVVQAQAA
jgi:uncharacterized MAPEG superfamily protein